MRKILSVTLLLCILLCSAVVSFSMNSSVSEDDKIKAADTLYEYGLFSGKGVDADGKPVYDLESAPTRAEAVTMLVKLLGKMDEAIAGEWETPFTDVPAWAEPFVGYAYENGLTAGTGSTSFGSSDTITASQYLTFILKALGYEAGTDFEWDRAWLKSDELGITSGEFDSEHNTLDRGNVCVISADALETEMKDGDRTLFQEITAPSPDISALSDDEQLQYLVDHFYEVKLDRDYRISKSIDISSDTVLDLNGHVISGTASGRTDEPPAEKFKIKNGADVTIENGSIFDVSIESFRDTVISLNDLDVITRNSVIALTCSGAVKEMRGCTISAYGFSCNFWGHVELIDNCTIISTDDNLAVFIADSAAVDMISESSFIAYGSFNPRAMLVNGTVDTIESCTFEGGNATAIRLCDEPNGPASQIRLIRDSIIQSACEEEAAILIDIAHYEENRIPIFENCIIKTPSAPMGCFPELEDASFPKSGYEWIRK